MLQSLKAHVCMCVCLYQVMQVEKLLIKHDVFLCSLLDQSLLTKWSGVKLSSNIKYLEAFALQSGALAPKSVHLVPGIRERIV